MDSIHKKIGIVLPTYNEEENIAGLLQNIYIHMPYATVLVVDDSPNEKTATVARQTIAQLSSSNKINYRVIKRNEAKGRASAVRAGFTELANEKFDFIIEMDTDGSHPPEQLPELITKAMSEDADIVICSRDLPESKIFGWPFKRHLLHFLANFSCRMLLRLGIRDYMNAYRIYSYRAAEVMLKDAGQISTGFWAFGESLVQIKFRGGKIKEIPTTFINRTRGQSQVKPKIIWGCLVELLKVYVLLHQLRRAVNCSGRELEF